MYSLGQANNRLHLTETPHNSSFLATWCSLPTWMNLLAVGWGICQREQARCGAGGGGSCCVCGLSTALRCNIALYDRFIPSTILTATFAVISDWTKSSSSHFGGPFPLSLWVYNVRLVFLSSSSASAFYFRLLFGPLAIMSFGCFCFKFAAFSVSFSFCQLLISFRFVSCFF